jgi:hypothetical protein
LSDHAESLNSLDQRLGLTIESDKVLAALEEHCKFADLKDLHDKCIPEIVRFE